MQNVECLLQATLRIYDEDVYEKYKELKDRYEKEKENTRFSKNYFLHYVINLAYETLEEERKVKEKHKEATEFETKDSLKNKQKNGGRKL